MPGELRGRWLWMELLTDDLDVNRYVMTLRHTALETELTIGSGNSVVVGEYFHGGSHIGYNRMAFRWGNVGTFQSAPGAHMWQVITEHYHDEKPIPLTMCFGLPPACTLIAGGGYDYVVLPRALGFLTTYNDEFFNIQIRANYYYSFVAYTLLAIGLVFCLPIFVLALVRLGVLTSGTLRRNRRIGIAIVIVGAALLPTVDPVSLVFETIPLLILYEGSIWAAVFFEKRWRARGLIGAPLIADQS